MNAKKRSPATKFDDIPGLLPQSHIPEDVDLPDIAKSTVSRLNGVAESDLAPNVIWRDYLSLTGTLRTLYSPKTVCEALQDLSVIRPWSNFKLTPDGWRITRLGPQTSWIDIGFTFSTGGQLPGAAAGIVSVIPSSDKPGEWTIWMLRTWLEHYEGHGDPDGLQPEPKISNETTDSSTAANNLHRQDSPLSESTEYGAVVVGGGQAGLGIAGRLKALDVPYLLVERNADIGDNWTSRYDSLRWHTSKHSGNLPFGQTYLPEDDYMLTTKMIADGFKRWSQRYDINARTSTSVEKASWDESKRRWTITLASPTGEEVIFAKNLVLAVGGYAGTPISPNWPGREKYKGTAIHGANYKSSKPWAGKAGVVVGTANTGHDVAEDMVMADFSSVTMVQRGQTFVFPAEWLHHAEDVMYHDRLPTATADRLSYTFPNKITREITNSAVFRLIDSSPERFDALERAGFKLERKGDIYDNLYCRFGGHYVDIGTSDRIVKGQIKMKSDSLVKEWTEDGLRFEDGSEIKADFIVMCTGFDHDFRKGAAKIIGEDAAHAMDDYFGMDPEGEIRGAFKLAGHPGLYYHGGDVRMARWFSRFIALQIQADILGKPLEPYEKTP